MDRLLKSTPSLPDDQRKSAHNWRESVLAFFHPRVASMLFLGFSAGVPILLIFSSLSLWLREAGVERSAVTFFSWAALGYSFKFVWAPLIDRLPLPLLSRLLGRRRAWLLVAQMAVIAAIVWMSSVDPAQTEGGLLVMALAAILLGFSSATQDIVIDAYRIESAKADLQALMSASYIAGYRIGMLVAGAGALFLAGRLGTEMGSYSYAAWQLTYLAMAGVMLVGVTTTLVIAEPAAGALSGEPHRTRDHLGFVLLFGLSAGVFGAVFFLSADASAALKAGLGAYQPLSGFIIESARLVLALALAGLAAWSLAAMGLVDRRLLRAGYVDPIQDFFQRYGARTAWLLLALIGVYRISDIVLGVISNVFYQDLGFSKEEIAAIVKTFGLFMTIAGGFLGGLLAMHYGVMRMLFWGALLSAATNLLFMGLAYQGHDTLLLYLVISADNLSAGLASAAFVAFLSSLTSISFTAVQYAVFSSLMTLLPKLLGGYSGGMVEAIGYPGFFLFTTLLGAPVLGLVWLAWQRLAVENGDGV